MAKFPTFKYEFKIGDETLLLAVGETATTKEGVLVKVHKYSKGELMNTVWYSCDGCVWSNLERGYRTLNGKFREDFKRFKMSYPAACGKVGHKSGEIYE